MVGVFFYDEKRYLHVSFHNLLVENYCIYNRCGIFFANLFKFDKFNTLIPKQEVFNKDFGVIVRD